MTCNLFDLQQKRDQLIETTEFLFLRRKMGVFGGYFELCFATYTLVFICEATMLFTLFNVCVVILVFVFIVTCVCSCVLNVCLCLHVRLF